MTDAPEPAQETYGNGGPSGVPKSVAERVRASPPPARFLSPERQRQFIYGTAGLLIVALLGVLLAWVFPTWLTMRPSSGMTAAQRLSAVNNARTALAALLVAIGAIGSLLFTGRSYRLNWEGHVTDRYTKAVSQLGDASSPVRVGGVYALERIAKDSAKDRTTIIYVLGVFVRERSWVPREREDEPAEDVKAGIRVCARLLALSSVWLNLRDADLRNADLSNLPMDQLMLEGADLRGAILPFGAGAPDAEAS